ncbi:helix-turn-helix domain-containing protein [Zoogloea sp.]|uniref:helix-turn-helix domain-containing protein n=1 Tax=Zoogloea sp. TaxID=49181 RepID=UPI00345A9F75
MSRPQTTRLLDALRQGSVSTFHARMELDIAHRAMRICESREAGHRIDTIWDHTLTSSGRRTRIALYTLIKEACL